VKTGLVAALGHTMDARRPLRPLGFLVAASLVAIVEIGIKVSLVSSAFDFSRPRAYAEAFGTRPESDLALLVWLIVGLVGSVVTVLLALRRVRDARGPEFAAALAMIPILRVPLLLFLALLPSRMQSDTGPTVKTVIDKAARWRHAVVAVGTGAAFSTASVAIGALIFGSYAHALYLLTPLYLGAVTGYLVNRHEDVGTKATAKAVWLATVVGSILLLAMALEGVICIVVIAPLAFVVALIGSALGRAVADSHRHTRVNALGMVLVVPFVFALESLASGSARFEVTTDVSIAAPPAVVWTELTQLEEITEPPGLLFRLGVAHPLRVELQGEGVGATRLSRFSTGMAVGRVTVWTPQREFAFDVLEEPPGMHELSPYAEVHAPHTEGYFRTSSARYRLELLPDGGTRLVETSSHALRMQPYEYWTPLARWIVGQTHARVLRQIQLSAERAAGKGDLRY